LTTFKDGTTSWQPEENFYSHDGEVITEAINHYYELVPKPYLPTLHAQVTKLKAQFKTANYPFSTAQKLLKLLIGRRSPYLQHEQTREENQERLASFTNIEQIQAYLQRTVQKWNTWIKSEKKHRKNILRKDEEKKTKIEQERKDEILQEKEIQKMDREIMKWEKQRKKEAEKVEKEKEKTKREKENIEERKEKAKKKETEKEKSKKEIITPT